MCEEGLSRALGTVSGLENLDPSGLSATWKLKPGSRGCQGLVDDSA